MLHRPRLDALISEGLEHPLLVMLAGPGYGKSQAMAAWLANSDARVLCLRLGSLDNLPTRLWGRLLHALEHEFSDLVPQLRTLEFPDTPSKFEAFLRILAGGFAVRRRVIWIFDDFGELHDLRVKNFFQMLVEAELENFRLVLISSALAGTESVAFMSSRRFLILGKDLRFTGEEITALYKLYGLPLEAGRLGDIERYTEGWPLPLHLLVLHRGRIQDLIQPDGGLAGPAISDIFEAHFFAAYPEPRQKLLVQLSFLDSFTRELAVDLCDGERGELETLNTHVFMTTEPATGQFFMHHLYRRFLQTKEYLLCAQEWQRLWQRAADYYAATSSEIEAISCYRKCGDHAGMLAVIYEAVKGKHGLSSENAAFLMEHLDLLGPQEAEAHPQADYLRAVVHLNMLQIEAAEALLLGLTQRLSGSACPEARTLLGDAYIMLGAIHMMRNQEDFGDYYKKAATYLPEEARRKKNGLAIRNNHNFSMADNRPGARERMEKAVHYGVPWAARVMGGGLSGMEHIFSAEAAYLTGCFGDAQQHAYRAIYKAAAHAQHDLVCNGHCLLARIGLMQGDLAEMTKQVENVVDYADKYNFGVLKEIRDTALGWYYIRLRDYHRIPKSFLAMNELDRPALAQDRSQIVYANYLLHNGEYARLVGMLENPRGLRLAKGIWPDRIALYIILAISHHKLGNAEASMKALWAAYDMTYHNGLTTPFIEAEAHMCALIPLARRQRQHPFSPGWLEAVERQAGAFALQADAVRAAYQKQSAAAAAKDNPLTRREMEILQSLSRGLTREEIAATHYVSVNTVKTFIRSIYNKLDAANRAEAVSIAISKGYIDVLALGVP